MKSKLYKACLIFIGLIFFSCNEKSESVSFFSEYQITHKIYNGKCSIIIDSSKKKNNPGAEFTPRDTMLTGSGNYRYSSTLVSVAKKYGTNGDKIIFAQHFLIFPLWTLKRVDTYNNEISYFEKEGKSFLKTFKYKKGNNSCDTAVMTIKDLPFYYDSNQILIPVSEKRYNSYHKFISIVNNGFVFILIIPIVLVLLFVFYLLKGLGPFTKRNVKLLKILFIYFLILPTLIIGFNLIQRLIFYKNFNEYVVIDNGFLWSFAKYLLVGVIFFVVYKILKRGYRIQQENDLTV